MTITEPLSPVPVIWEHNRSIVDQIVQCVEEGSYCALLGPRFSGKTALLQHVQKLIQENLQPCIYINLFEIQAPTQAAFFTNLVGTIATGVSKHAKRPLPLPAEELSSAAFRDFLSGCVAHLKSNLTVIFDHLEGLPTDLNRALLTSLRALYIEQQDRELQVIAIVSGALSLAALTVGETSPFRGIARRLILGHPDEAESKKLVAEHSDSAHVQVSQTARALLLESTRGNPHLIKYICTRSLAAATGKRSKRVGAQTVSRVIREFLYSEARNYDPLQEATHLIEDDPELLQCILKLLKSESVPRRELPLPLFPDLDPLYLTGMVEKVGEDRYRIRNEIYRQYLSQYFDAARAGYLLTVSGQWDAAIGHLEASIASGNEQSRTDLLAATINAMYASETEELAAYYLIRGLSVAFRVIQIYIWLLARDGRTLAILDQKGTTVEGALPVHTQELPIEADRIEARSFRQACILLEHQVDACTKYVIPLMIPGQPPVGVVTLCESVEAGNTQTEQRQWEFQLQSFLNQAARAFFEVQFRRKREAHASERDAQLEKQTHQLFLLHRISTLSQTIPDLEKISHLILTAITAHFGLGFNRAWLFLIDRKANCLVGRMGIGSFTEEQTYQAWDRSTPLSFEEYVARLLKDQVEYNAIDQPTRKLRISISENSNDLFSMTVYHRHTFQWSNAPGHWHALPQEFKQRFEPGEMILTPLVVQNNCLGLITVDCKFRPRLFTETDELLLKTFANQMATAIFNNQQREQEMQRLKLEETLRDTSLIIGGSLELKEVLHRILEEMRKVLPFDTASIQLAIDETHSLKIIANTGFDDPERVEALSFPMEEGYPNVLVYEKREPLHFDDVQEHFPHFADPHYQATHVHGWLGAPLIIDNRAIGVITLDSKTAGIYTSEHDRMAALFAGQASVAIKNARSFQTEKETKDYLDLLISSSQDGIIAVDNHGWVVRFSEGAQKILGYSAEEVLNKQKRVDELYGSIDIARDINAMLMALDKVRDYPASIVDKQHNLVPIVLSATLLRDKQGNPLGSVGFFKDLRPLRKVENNLRMILDTVSIMSEVDHSEAGLSSLAERIVTAQPVTFCSILLLDESKKNLVVKVAHPNPRLLSTGVRWKPAVGKRIPLTQAELMTHLMNLPASQVFRQGQRIEGRDVIQDLQQYVLLDEEIQSILIVPLKAGSEVFGICIVGETRSWERSPFDDEKVELISSMMTQGTVFVDRLRAHEATQNKLMMVERLRSIGEDLVAAAPGASKDILDKVVRAACEVTGASSAVIYPWDAQKRTYDTDRIVHFGLHKKKSFSKKVRHEEGSMTSVVVRKGMVIVDDIQEGLDRSGETRIWARKGRLLDVEGVRAFIGVALRIGKDALGGLFVNFLEPHYFSDSELEAVNLFANQAAIAIENARLYEDLALRLEESTILQKVGTSLTDTRDLNTVLDRVLQAAFELIHAGEANILFYDESKDEFRPDALKSEGSGLPLQSYLTLTRQRDGYTYEIIKSKKLISIPDTTRDPRINPMTLRKGRRAAVGVPLIGRESPVGVLWMHWKDPHQISKRDERLLTALAGQAAISIENANLFDQLKAENARKYEESRALQEIGISLTETIDENGVLYRVFQAALELVDAEEGSILLYDETRDEFQTEALKCAGIGQPLETYTTQVRQGAGLAYEIIQGRKPIYIPDTTVDPRISKVAIDKGRRATVGVPLLDHEGPVGVLWVNWKTTRQVSSSEASLLTALASQATVAIKGARRYAEVQKYTRFQNGLLKAGLGIINLKEARDVLQSIIENIKTTFDCDVVTLYTYDQETRQVDFPAYVCGELVRPEGLGNLGRVSKESVVMKIVELGQPYFADHSTQDRVMVSELYERQEGISPFVQREGILSSAGIPLIVADKTVGILFVNYRSYHPFSDQEQNAIRLYAAQAATVIQLARTYEAIQRRSAHLQAVHEAGKVISAASVGLDLQQILDRILEQAIECVTGVSGSKASVGTIQLLEEETNELVVKSVFPLQYPQLSIDKFDHISLDPKKAQHGKIGVTGRAALTRQAQLVPDVSADKDYIVHNSDTKSELAIPMLDNGTVVGVMDVESNELNAFDELDKVSLGLLVDLAVVALRNAEQADQLARSNAVGLMGAWGAEIVHGVNREVGNIRREVFLLGRQPALPEEVKQGLGAIDQFAKQLALPEIPERIPGTESATAPVSAVLDSAIHTAVQIYRSEYPSISIQFKPGCSDTQVAMHERFILSIFQNLLRNAVHALTQGDPIEKKIKIRSRLEGPMAMIEMENSGPGFRPEIVPFLFKRLIPHEDGRKGRGLLLVGFLVEQHGGRIEAVQNKAKNGVLFRFWLPLFQPVENTPEA